MTLLKQIDQLTKELCSDAEPNRERVMLLKALMLDLRQQEKNNLEVLKFRFIEEHRDLLTKNETPSPNWMDRPQGLGRRLLDCDNQAKAAITVVDAATG